MFSILFICHGNICRSTMAEYVMKDLVEQKGMADAFFIDSAATSTEEIGNGVHHGTRSVLRRHGIYCGNHRARQMTRDDLRTFDLVVCMDERNVANARRMFGDEAAGMRNLMEFAGESRDVADPWYTGDFDTTYRDVSKGCAALLSGILNGDFFAR